MAGLPPLTVATGTARWTAALRAGYWCATLAIMAAALASHRLDDPRWWLLALGGPAGAAAAGARVGLRLDGQGVRLRSVLWTRQRRWADLTRLGVSELLLPGKYGTGITTPVLAFDDYLGARLRAVATVRCWQQPWLAEIIRRCETAGLDIDAQLDPQR